MDQERTQKLEEIGFDLDSKDRDKANDVLWNSQFNKLREYDERHGHCELFWAVSSYSFILNTPTNSPHVSLPTLQVKCLKSTRKTRHWAFGSTISVHTSKMAK
jgi:hypothetical protein